MRKHLITNYSNSSLDVALSAVESLPGNITSQVMNKPKDNQSSYSLVPSRQLGFYDESQVPIQNLYNSTQSAKKNAFNNEYGDNWAKTLAVELAQRWITGSFCSWYSTGGSIPNLLDQLPEDKLKQTGADTSYTGYMFEKYDTTNLNAGGSGGGE